MTHRVISLYSGAGGMDYGFEAAGFHTAVALDFDKHCSETLRHNRSWPVIEGDVTKVDTESVLATAGLAKREASVLIGGPPCQPFSKSGFWHSGESLRLKDPRANTVEAYMRVVEDALPKVFLLENVEGLAYADKQEALSYILHRVREINSRHGTKYDPRWAILNAAEYGVPQQRFRFFMVGSRDGQPFRFPAPTHYVATGSAEQPLEMLEPARTAWDALGDLNNADFDAEDLRMRGKWAELLPSIPEGHNYLWHTERGGGLPLFGWRRRYWTFLLKLGKDRPSWTIQAQPGPAIGPFHWSNRRLSMRELCRLQTIPDDVHISGNLAAVQRQVGNAVPSLLAEVLAREILRQYLGVAVDTPRLMPPKRLPVPAPAPVAAVPAQYLLLTGSQSAHPGTGRGHGALKRASGQPQPSLHTAGQLLFPQLTAPLVADPEVCPTPRDAEQPIPAHAGAER